MKKTAICGVLISLALIMSYIESLIPTFIPIPGIKLGLANLLIVFALYRMDVRFVVFISLIRVVLAGLMFGNMSSVIYGLAGAVFALSFMYIVKISGDFHIITVSVCGAVAHILGQLIIAGAITSYGIVMYYAPYLLIAALLTGTIIGYIAEILIGRIPIDIE